MTLPALFVATAKTPAPSLLSAESNDKTLQLRPWGGTRLWRGRGLDHPRRGEPLGEAWEFSTLAGHESSCLARPLSEILGHPLPFLAKLVDVARPLSVQVHPEGPQGKEEAWIVLDAEPGAYILAGLAPGIDARDFEKALAYADSAHGRQDEVFECLQAHPVVQGSVVVIPPQTVHTIPSQVLIAEIQDPNDLTYRFFDYGSQRELHRAQAFAHLNPAATPIVWQPEPGLNAHRLSGQRVQLQIMGPGTHELDWQDAERLLVSVRGTSQVQVRGQTQNLSPGSMNLAQRGPIGVQVQPDSMAVLAWLDD